jgi:hypothetical protein
MKARGTSESRVAFDAARDQQRSACAPGRRTRLLAGVLTGSLLVPTVGMAASGDPTVVIDEAAPPVDVTDADATDAPPGAPATEDVPGADAGDPADAPLPPAASAPPSDVLPEEIGDEPDAAAPEPEPAAPAPTPATEGITTPEPPAPPPVVTPAPVAPAAPADAAPVPPSDVPPSTPTPTASEPQADTQAGTRHGPAPEHDRRTANRRAHPAAPAPLPTSTGPAVSAPDAVPSHRIAHRTDPGARVHLVHVGESLWSIAASTISAGAGDAEIAQMVQRLWMLNRDHLSSVDPDLIRVGERLILPARGGA